MTFNENKAGTNQQIEHKFIGYFALYIAEPEFRLTMQK
jgi:hypothetical protein